MNRNLLRIELIKLIQGMEKVFERKGGVQEVEKDMRTSSGN